MADRKISELTALTTPASNDYLPIVDVSEAAASDKNKRITVSELLRGAPDGTAGAPGFAFESDGDNGMFRSGTNAIGFSTAGSQRVTIDSSGRLLFGGTSALPVNSISAGVEIHATATSNGASISIARFNSDAAGPQLSLGKSRNTTVAAGTIVQNGDDLGQIVFGGDDGTDLNTTAARIQAFVDGTPGANDMPGRLAFYTTADGASSPTERMRIKNNGHIYFNSPDPLSAGSTGTVFFSTARKDSYIAGTTTATHWAFGNNNGIVGSITTNASATAYNTSSDYRLKENVTAVTDGITRLQQLKPSRFNFIADPAKTVDGFIAHEVQSVVPEAITGEKDAMDDEGNPEYQGIDQSKLVPLLTAALQEAIAKIETLEAKVAALESA